ncbi:MAG: alcohol dehydrogenase catalytic domain-containing protein, partial [Desulfobacterales bacterium]
MIIKAYAALTAGGKLEPFEYDPGKLGVDQVEIDISHCGLCHSDLSMLNNDWQMTEYPLVPGHEI